MESHPFVCPASRCTYGFTGHVTKAYVNDSNQIMVAYWSVYGDFSPTLYIYRVKAVPLQAWIGPEGSRKLRLPDFMTTAQDGGKVHI